MTACSYCHVFNYPNRCLPAVLSCSRDLEARSLRIARRTESVETAVETSVHRPAVLCRPKPHFTAYP